MGPSGVSAKRKAMGCGLQVIFLFYSREKGKIPFFTCFFVKEKGKVPVFFFFFMETKIR